MDKRYAAILAFLVTALIIFNVYSFSLFKERDSFIIARVIDGDTVQTNKGEIIRLLNINSPEKGTKGYNLSKEYLASFINDSLYIKKKGADKYGRTLGKIYSPDYLNLKIVELGFASKFLVADEELKYFSEAERKAIEKSLGIWNKSIHYGCFSSYINKKDEYIILKNKCLNLDISGWTMKDESRKIYKFNEIEVGEITIHSGKGTNNLSDLFFGSSTNIWNDDRDTLYLFDENGGIVHFNSYGY